MITLPLPRICSTLVTVCSLFLVARFALSAESPTAGEGGTLPQSVQDVLVSNELPKSSLSVFVQDVQSSRPLIAFNATTPRNPASVMKLVTTLAALEEFGPGHRWETEALASTPMAAGRLEGHLYLRGGGDPYIVTESFWRFLRELRKQGLEHIGGDLVVDNSLFEVEPEDPGEFDGRPYRSYNVTPRALLVNFNTVRFQFRPDENGKRVIITPDPPLTTMTIDNQLELIDGDCGTHLRRLRMEVAVNGEVDTVQFRGKYPTSCGTFAVDRSVNAPLPYVYGIFDALWQEMGGSIDGSVRAGMVPEDARRLYRMQSLTLAELIRAINKHSNNVMTRGLLLSLGVARYGEPGSIDKGRRAIVEWLDKRRIPRDGLVLDNGSGRSRTARITVATLGELLLAAYRSPLMPEFVSSLPLSGIDGTMRLRYRHDPLEGRLHVKTGLIDDVNAIAGYLVADDGHTYVVAAMQNHPGIHRGRGRHVQDALLEWLYRR
jgi:D-alanyl-D-alanine carboxypeptidase/D-alanyl-D-alanine-endopeptidase (penicillin-binding protein 4)